VPPVSILQALENFPGTPGTPVPNSDSNSAGVKANIAGKEAQVGTLGTGLSDSNPNLENLNYPYIGGELKTPVPSVPEEPSKENPPKESGKC
jgi:hypothetical protein